MRMVPRMHGSALPDISRPSGFLSHKPDIAPVAELVTEAEDYVRASDPLMAGMGDGKGEPWVPEKFIGKPGDGQGLRYNDGKPRFDLLPPEALKALAEHYGKGAEKYAARNWERGMDWCKCFASLERHAWAWMGGEDIDPENGSHHMIAVAWNAIALFTYAMRNIGTDDRPK
ncbi:MAG TPA: dATP/dGTP diphosphohydrolase domain-containing protein [Candidatus Angelobacter sp.]|nr:dATP/dGTP diphosphohydrolase domain-containing protein [Candidatus Angelobacter sp.]